MFIVIENDLIINVNHFISALRGANGNLEIKMVDGGVFNITNISDSKYNDFINALNGIRNE